jgi:uncharacterized protein (TIGR02646 family)
LISINRPNRPVELTDQVKQDLTQKFMSDGENVWSKSYIKSALLTMAHNKCAYCECKLDEESKYMEVEHFLPKDDYPYLVVDWDNLLPSCKRCNVRKRKHDPSKEPIINPTVDKPNSHLRMYNYWIKGKDEKGKMTIDVLHLNEIDRLVHPRMLIGIQTIDTLETLLEKAERYFSGNTGGRLRNQIINGTLQLLREAQPQSEFSATVASIIFSNEDFFELKRIMIDNDLWDDEHHSLLQIAESNILVNPLQVSGIS